MKLLLAPHNDDETLFAAYTLMREQPLVLVCLYPRRQEFEFGIFPKTRTNETHCAMQVLGCEWRQLRQASDVRDEPERLRRDLQVFYDYSLDTSRFEQVWLPEYEIDGHEQHNMVAQVAREFWPNALGYMTYRRGSRRSRGRYELEPTPEEIALKRQALDCYRSQIELETTAPWFSDEYEWQREWLA